jgi:hypothetical protein
MRKKLAVETRREFERLMQQRQPQFRRIHVDGYPPDCPIFEWRATDISFYVGLTMSPGDAFSAAGAWSQKGRFPFRLAPVMFPRDMPDEDIVRDEPVEGEFAFQLNWLWGKPEPYQWQLSLRDPIAEFGQMLHETDDARLDQLKIPEEAPLEECRAQIRTVVEDVVDKIERYAIPYFHEIAAIHGGKGER